MLFATHACFCITIDLLRIPVFSFFQTRLVRDEITDNNPKDNNPNPNLENVDINRTKTKNGEGLEIVTISNNGAMREEIKIELVSCDEERN